MKIITIIGARPQFVKAAVISRAIFEHNKRQAIPQIKEVLVHTGQHYDINMSDIFFEEMHIPKPDYKLGIGGGSHGAMTGQMLEQIESVLLQENPDVVLVYGDTNSTLAGALAAVKLHIPVAHVEAGLRSFNLRMPEEINRILTDRISKWLFCPTDNAIKNLQHEGYNIIAHRKIDGDPVVRMSNKIFEERNLSVSVNVGDVMNDAALYYKQIAVPSDTIISLLEKLAGGFYLATVHRAENTDNSKRLNDIMRALEDISKDIPVVLPLHPRTRKSLEQNKITPRYIQIIDPVGYFDMITLLSQCNGVFTDSGGLQKEAYFFQKQCITLRDETEWVELVENGLNTLAGARAEKIFEAERHLRQNTPDFSKTLYGTGHAGEIIVEYLAEYHRL